MTEYSDVPGNRTCLSVPQLIDQLSMLLSDMHNVDHLGAAPDLVRQARDEIIAIREVALQVMRESDQEGRTMPAELLDIVPISRMRN